MNDRVLAIPLIRTGDHPSAERRALQRRVHRGSLASIRPGVLVDPSLVQGLRSEDRLLLLVRATVPSVGLPRAFSHSSAATVHRLPFTAAAPDRVEVVDPRLTRPDTTALARVRPGHAIDDSGGRWAGTPPTVPIEIDGAPVTSLVRTLVDLSATAPLDQAVPMIDQALRERRVLPEMLRDELSSHERKGSEKAGVAIGMGSALSGSPAESVCRVRFRQIGAPEPVQQYEFRRTGGGTAVVDFWFPDQGVVVEVDGRAKYEDPTMLEGRSTAEAHWQEKRREDFVRSFPEVRFVIRLSWADLMQPDRVRAALRRAGVPCR
ncbi:hypothetical protein [Curtobacterium sp. NPDC089991]|uniref:hypothetical protein n=1 Tax=Curtobacterium sp. NPDC089991 TaxID=3363969 RepID=UPI00380239A1